jgi:hypothetical protein
VVQALHNVFTSVFRHISGSEKERSGERCEAISATFKPIYLGKL